MLYVALFAAGVAFVWLMLWVWYRWKQHYEREAVKPLVNQLDRGLDRLLADVKALGPMTDEEREAQRRSFVYGNLKIDRPELTREEFDRIVDENQRENCKETER